MSKCLQCKVEILDDTNRCPLCNSVLEQTVEMENMYPDVRVKSRKLTVISRVYLFGAILLETLLLCVNAAMPGTAWWSLIAGLALLYGYMLLRYAILGTAGYASKIIVLTLIAVLMAVAADFAIGYRGWSVNYVLPAGILFLDAGILILMFVNRRNWQSYILMQIGTLLAGAVALALSAAGIVTRPGLATVAFAVSAFLFLGTMIIGGRRARTELKRRFHIR